jgi:hypothetical protein
MVPKQKPTIQTNIKLASLERKKGGRYSFWKGILSQIELKFALSIDLEKKKKEKSRVVVS